MSRTIIGRGDGPILRLASAFAIPLAEYMPFHELNSFLHYIDHWADQTPSSPAWWLEKANSQFQPISWQEFRLRLLNTISRFRVLNLPNESRIVTCDRNSLQWVLVDLACQAMNWIHVPIDTRLSDSSKQSICHRTNPLLFVVLENAEAFAFLDQSTTNVIGKVGWDHCPVQLPQASPLAKPGLMKSEPMALATGFDIATISPIAPEANAYGSGTRLFSLPPPKSDSIATILYTSGSTSSPKGVQLSHKNLLSNARAKLDAMPQFTSDRRLNLLPFSHAYARTCELSTWIVSGSSIMTVDSIEMLLRVAPQFEPTLINGVPYLFKRIQKHVRQNKSLHRSEEAEDNDSVENQSALRKALGTQLRMLAAGGAGLDKATFDWFSACGYPIYQGYGLTEAGPVVCSNRYPSPSSNNVGFPVAETCIRIDSDQRLFVKGPGVMLGYDGDEEATRERICDGWLDTGDLAEWTSEGAVRILGRIDDRITLPNGYKIDPSPIERKICKVLGVDHCLLTLNDLQRLLLIVPVNGSKGFHGIQPPRSEPTDCLRFIRDSIADEPSYAFPVELLKVENDWSEATGMLNAKGALQRYRIASRYLGGIK
ncbi:MAG: AMP-binding protein [Planctomycetota bacterium]|nr:AMP-binding protein [Planctomycetota bacterium]